MYLQNGMFVHFKDTLQKETRNLVFSDLILNAATDPGFHRVRRI